MYRPHLSFNSCSLFIFFNETFFTLTNMNYITVIFLLTNSIYIPSCTYLFYAGPSVHLCAFVSYMSGTNARRVNKWHSSREDS